MEHKLGIIGYGTMGSWHAEQVTKRIDGLTVTAVYDIREEKRGKARADGFTAYDTYEEFVRADCDIVLVATPNNFHAYYAQDLMRRGKHVVSEKPVCMSLAELDETIAVAKETGRVFTVHQNRRWDDDYVLLRQILDRKLVGNVYFLESRLYSSRGISGDWRSSREAGGGLLYDWGAHMIDQVLLAVDSPPVAVYAQLVNVRYKEVDDTFSIFIDFESGVRAHITADLWCYINEARWHVSGDDGTALIPKWFGAENEIVKSNIKTVNWQEGVLYTRNGLSRTMWPRPVTEVEKLSLPAPEPPRWEEFYENLMLAVEGKAEQTVTHAQMRKVMRVIECGFESARTNQVVKFTL